MDEQPQKPEAKHLQAKRRWFRFRLSTVLILTAIVAWTMALRPHFGLFYYHDIVGYWYELGHVPLVFNREAYWLVSVASGNPTTGQRGLHVYIGRNSGLTWPALALAAFLAWKAAWAVVERRRRRSAAPG